MKKSIIATCAALSLAACANETTETTDNNNAKEAVETVYNGFATGDIPMAISTMAEDVEWREAEGNPYADNNPYVGTDAIITGLFARLGGEWDSFAAVPSEFVVDGDRVVVFGRYTGTYLGTGEALDAPFAHSWTVKDGKIVSYQQYTDTAEHVAVMSAD